MEVPGASGHTQTTCLELHPQTLVQPANTPGGGEPQHTPTANVQQSAVVICSRQAAMCLRKLQAT